MLSLRRTVYLDNNATTQPSPRVIKRVTHVLNTCYGNPSSRYRVGQAASSILEDARSRVAASIAATPSEIVFTSGATEANNQIVKCFARANSDARDTIVSTPIEHPSVLQALKAIEEQGMRLLTCPVNGDGIVDVERLKALVDERTALVCCMLVNNETGVVQDVAEVANVAHAGGALVFCDAVQALGKIPVNVRTLDVDYLSLSAHKVHGPKGVGALFARSGVPLSPLMQGGHQEGSLRSGTESLHNIAGFGAACEELEAHLAMTPRIAGLRDRLATAIFSMMPTASVNTPRKAVANTLSVTLPGIDAGHAIALLDYHGIAVSAGSACNTQSNEPSHVLAALGLSEAAARQTLRFSLGSATAAADIAYVERILRTHLLADGPDAKFPVTMIRPSQVDEDMLRNERLFFLDIRSAYDRKLLHGLPGAYETSFKEIRRGMSEIPRHKSILVICQAGTDSAMVAYYLRSKGFRDVAFLIGGIVGWKLAQPKLYERVGQRTTKSFGTTNPSKVTSKPTEPSL